VIRLGIAAESSGDATLITGLVDRVLLDEHDWVTDDTLDDYRVWGGLGVGTFLDLHRAKREAKDRRLRIHGTLMEIPAKQTPRCSARSCSSSSLKTMCLRWS
jgi:hypothetical protein